MADDLIKNNKKVKCVPKYIKFFLTPPPGKIPQTEETLMDTPDMLSLNAENGKIFQKQLPSL